MQCPRCRAQNRPSRRFCMECGAPLPSACPACGYPNEPSEKFCGGCGTPIARLTPEGTQSSALASTATWPAGELRPVTVLFADLCGFTRLSRESDPETVHEILGRYFAAVDGMVGKYGGVIDKHIGDSVMAVFGAPIAHGNDPERAVRAAVDIHNAVTEVGRSLGRPLQVHIGIASGQVVASRTGSEAHHEYTITGDSVNLAARLQDRAAPDETLISETVYRAVAPIARCEPVGDVSLKGLERSVRIWRVAGLGQHEARTGVKIVDRRAELRQFAGVVESCRKTGCGQTVFVRGDAGIGKTRLVDEFERIGRDGGFHCCTGLVLDFGAGRGEDAIRTIVRRLLGVVPGSGSKGRRGAAEKAIADGLIRVERAAYLYDLLNIALPLESRAVYSAMDNADRNRGKRDTLVELIHAASTRQPLLIRIEDIHWADRIVLMQLAALAAGVHECPALLMMTSRLEGDPIDQAWRSLALGAPLLTIDIGPLRDEDSFELARQYRAEADHALQHFIKRAEGNPLFLEQLLRGMDETAENRIPGSIQSLVLARIDALEPADRQAIQAASVIGQRLSVDLLRRVIGDAGYSCDALVRNYLVRPEGDDYLFAHALIRDGVYGSLLKGRRRELHRRTAEWFIGRDPVLRAEHLDRAEDPEAPVAYREAARAEAGAYHYERALGLVERGLVLATSRGDQFALTCLRADLLQQLGNPEASIAGYERALELADGALGSCRAWIGICAGVRLLGGYEKGIEALAAAEPIARAHGGESELAQIHFYRGALYFAAGNVDGCLAEQSTALEHAGRAGDPEWQAAALGGLSDAHYARGRMRAAFDCARRCLDLCGQHALGRIEVGQRYVLGVVRRYLNELEAGLRDILAAAEMADKVGHRRAQMYARMLQGEFLIEAAQADLAAAPLEQSLALAETMHNDRFKAYVMYQQARALLARDRRAEAEALLDVALEISRRTGVTFIGPRLFGILAIVTADPERRRLALAEGEEVLRMPCISHNVLWFYRDAIEASLDAKDWKGASHYADLLEAYTRPEPVPWADFFIARGRVLARYGAGDRTTLAMLENLRETAERIGFRTALPAIERALAQR